MRNRSASDESVAEISVSRRFGFLAVSIALAALMLTRPALAARRHHAAAAPAASSEEESAATSSSTALGAYSEACVLEPTTGTVIFESNDREPWPTASLAKMMLMLIVAEKLHDGSLKLTDNVTTSRKAAEMGYPFVIAVVDDSGVLKAFSRMDGAPLLSVQVAQDKAYTAVGFGMATDAWHDFVKDDPPLAMGAAPGIDRLVVFGGGYPIKVGGAVVGGIGVSGGHYSQDMDVAQAGLSAVPSA